MNYILSFGVEIQCKNQKDITRPIRSESRTTSLSETSLVRSDSYIPTPDVKGFSETILMYNTGYRGSVCFYIDSPYCKVPGSLIKSLRFLLRS